MQTRGQTGALSSTLSLLYFAAAERRNNDMKAFLSFFFLSLFLFPLSLVFAWPDLCQEAKETPHMTNVRFEKFFEDEMKGKTYSGKGVLRNVRSNSPSEYVVIVDCLNGVTANVIVSSSSAKDLKVGDEVEFSGECALGFRRAFRGEPKWGQFFELRNGNVK